MNNSDEITRVDPAAAIPGGEIVVEYTERDVASIIDRLWVGDQRAHLVAAGRRRALSMVPALKSGGNVPVRIGDSVAGDTGIGSRLLVGKKLAEDLHPVTSPAFDPDDGSLYLTRSGGRGDRLPVTLFRIDENEDLTEVSGDITNPTAIAFDRNGQMFVTSRMDGTVYRVTPFHEAVAFVSDLGIATGLAFDRQGRMYVGDRTGTIYRVSGIGEAHEFAHVEPSVSAYHLAFGPDDYLYVTGPTVTSYDVVTRIDPSGQASIFFRGLGRPQGLAFDRDGNLYVAASLAGRRGIVRVDAGSEEAELFVAGMNLVGLAFSASGQMLVVSNDSVYSLNVGLQGALLG